MPREILEDVFLQLSPSLQSTLHACTLVSRTWYPTAVQHLYDTPAINGKNFDLFVRAVCPSVNAHIRQNGLAELVKNLNMSRLVHNGSRSLTARLLGRFKGQLETFVAPQASFAVNSLAALSKCSRLQCLDLSLVSEAIPMSNLFHSIAALPSLRILRIPRASAPDLKSRTTGLGWPAKLQELYISGGLDGKSVLFDLLISSARPTLARLSMEYCPHVDRSCILTLLKAQGIHLQYLRIGAPMRLLHKASLNEMVVHLPKLIHLSISVDFIDANFFEAEITAARGDLGALQSLDLDTLDAFKPDDWMIQPEVIWNAIADQRLPSLRELRVHRKIGWMDTVSGKVAMAEIDGLLKALERERAAAAGVDAANAGVIVFGRR